MKASVAGRLVHKAHHTLNGKLCDRKVELVLQAQIQILADQRGAVHFAFLSKDRTVVSSSPRQHDGACVRLFPELNYVVVGFDVLRFTAGKFFEERNLRLAYSVQQIGGC